ncbi:MAG: SIS domain-containing protein [Steroidobacteraceae bacterium]|jgi:D-sedoheptulose 7-phosphate isomerase
MLPGHRPSETSPAAAQALLQQELREHREAFEATAQMLSGPFAETLGVLERGLRCGGKLLIFGNGGSAADAQHIAAELTVRYETHRAPISAIALTTDTSALTACANDWGFDAVFERQIEGLAREHDVAFGISTSGNSNNVLKGLRRARAMGLQTVGLTGGTGGQMREFCDALIVVPSPVTARIQEMHITIGHVLCKALEQRLGPV